MNLATEFYSKGATLGATGADDLPILRTEMDNR